MSALRKSVAGGSVAVGCLTLALLCWRCVDDPVVTPTDQDPCPACTLAVDLDTSNFAALTGVVGRVSMVEFYSPSCPACVAMIPVIDSLAARFAGRALVGRVNTLYDDTLYQAFGVQAIPACVFLDGGVEYARHVGITVVDTLAALLEQGLAKSAVALR